MTQTGFFNHASVRVTSKDAACGLAWIMDANQVSYISDSDARVITLSIRMEKGAAMDGRVVVEPDATQGTHDTGTTQADSLDDGSDGAQAAVNTRTGDTAVVIWPPPDTATSGELAEVSTESSDESSDGKGGKRRSMRSARAKGKAKAKAKARNARNVTIVKVAQGRGLSSLFSNSASSKNQGWSMRQRHSNAGSNQVSTAKVGAPGKKSHDKSSAEKTTSDSAGRRGNTKPAAKTVARHVKKRTAKHCNVSGCTSVKQGTVALGDSHGSPGPRCRKHGAVPKKRMNTKKYCSVSGCTKLGQGKKLLAADHRGPVGFRCARHGGSWSTCNIPGCHKQASGKAKREGDHLGPAGGRCVGHGGGTRCSVDGCEKFAYLKAVEADEHGPPGRRCKFHRP